MLGEGGRGLYLDRGRRFDGTGLRYERLSMECVEVEYERRVRGWHVSVNWELFEEGCVRKLREMGVVVGL